MNRKVIYHKLISLLSMLEVSEEDKVLFKMYRKIILDIANDILRLDNE